MIASSAAALGGGRLLVGGKGRVAPISEVIGLQPVENAGFGGTSALCIIAPRA